MRLGWGEYYFPHKEFEPIQGVAQLQYFKVVLENEPELVEDLLRDVYTSFSKLSHTEHVTTYSWSDYEEKVILIQRPIEEAEEGWRAFTEEQYEAIMTSIAERSLGGNPREVLELHEQIKHLRDKHKLEKFGEWFLNAILGYLLFWTKNELVPTSDDLKLEVYPYVHDSRPLSVFLGLRGEGLSGDAGYLESFIMGYRLKFRLLPRRFYDYEEQRPNDEILSHSTEWDFFEPHYIPTHESRASAKKRIAGRFSLALKAYLDSCEAAAKHTGAKERPKQRKKGDVEIEDRYQ